MEDGVKLQRCELCRLQSRVYCAADEASLCWECDAQVHGANFLVARHFRSLLCSKCRAPTGRFETGFRIEPKIYLCKPCAHSSDRADEESEIASSASSVVSDRSSSESEGLRQSGRRRVVSESGTTGLTGGKGSSNHRDDGDCTGWMQPGSESARADLSRCEEWWSVTSVGMGTEDEGCLGERGGWRCRSKRSRREVEEDCVSSAYSGVGSVDSVIQAQKKKKKKEKKSCCEAL